MVDSSLLEEKLNNEFILHSSHKLKFNILENDFIELKDLRNFD